MASISISYLFDYTPDAKKIYRVWHDGLIVGQFENRQEAELLKNYYNEIENQNDSDQGNQREPKQSS
jgi:hypothetical protein